MRREEDRNNNMKENVCKMKESQRKEKRMTRMQVKEEQSRMDEMIKKNKKSGKRRGKIISLTTHCD